MSRISCLLLVMCFVFNVSGASAKEAQYDVVVQELRQCRELCEQDKGSCGMGSDGGDNYTECIVSCDIFYLSRQRHRGNQKALELKCDESSQTFESEYKTACVNHLDQLFAGNKKGRCAE